MAHKFNPGDRVVVKRDDWKSYWASAGGQWGDYDSKTYTIDEWDGDDVTPGYKLKECGFRSLEGSGVFTEGWFDPAPKFKGGGKGEGKGIPGELKEGEGGEGEPGEDDGDGEGTPGEGKGEGEESKDGKDSKDSKDSKDGKDGKGKDSKDMPKKKEDKKDSKDQKDQKDQKQDNKVMIKDIPAGRVGRYTGIEAAPHYLLIIMQEMTPKESGKQIIQFWPGYNTKGELVRGPLFKTMTEKENQEYFDNTEVELLPEDTTVMLLFNGKWGEKK